MKIARAFQAREEQDQRWLSENTWCGHCDEADLGMHDIKEYEEDSRVTVEGICNRCGSAVMTVVNKQDRAVAKDPNSSL